MSADTAESLLREGLSSRTAVDGLVYDFVESSDSSEFYATFYGDDDKRPEKPELWAQVKASYGVGSDKVDPTMAAIVERLADTLAPESVVVELGGSSHQRRSANIYERFPNYFPVDISRSTIEKYAEAFGRVGFVADATTLPFRDRSLDAVVTHTFLEHPIRPDQVVEEIARVVKPGGMVVHADAWFCRWWQRYGVVGLKRFGSMTFRERAITMASKLTEFPLVRFPPILAGRAIKYVSGTPNAPIALRYKALKPNYDLYLGCDEDAAASIDPFDLARFYESRGFTWDVPRSFSKRVLFRGGAVWLRAPDA